MMLIQELLIHKPNVSMLSRAQESVSTVAEVQNKNTLIQVMYNFWELTLAN